MCIYNCCHRRKCQINLTQFILKCRRHGSNPCLIKEKKAPHLNHVAASDLELWMVDIHLDELGAKPVNVNLDIYSKLSPPHMKLSFFFNGTLDDERLHIVAKASGTSH